MRNPVRTQQGEPTGEKQLNKKGKIWRARILVVILATLIMVQSIEYRSLKSVHAQGGSHTIYLPAVTSSPPPLATPLIHIPFFNVQDVYKDRYAEMAVFWFGKVSPTENYNHVRLGYNQQRLSMEVSIYDRRLWYDANNPTPAEVGSWDSTSIYLYIPASKRLLRFDAQLSFWEERPAYQAVFEKTSSGWKQISIPFTTKTVYRGDGINSAADGKGWWANFEIPFTSLGVSSAPEHLSTWRLGVTVSDQDNGPGGATLRQGWPKGFSENNLNSFGQITFGYAQQGSPVQKPSGRLTLRQGGGISVPDGAVGGNTTCGGNADYWSEWGNLVYDSGSPSQQVAIQNQMDVSDFPCFSRYYITFPLGMLPAGKVILSAELTMHHFGNSDPENAWPSYIQVFRVKDGWTESTLSWNNSPEVFENYPGTWVEPVPADYPTVPGTPYTWDVTRALKAALQSQSPHELRLVLQSADSAMHSGKYFWASETANWNNVIPPSLTITWGEP